MMIIVRKTAPQTYVEMPPGQTILFQMDSEVSVYDTEYADKTIVMLVREETVYDATIVEGTLVRTPRIIQATDERLSNSEIVSIERKIPVTEVIQHPWTIVYNWSTEELEAIDLYRLVETEIPEGKVSLGWHVEEINGKPTQVHTLQDAPPPPVPQTISRRQLLIQMVVDQMITPEEALAAATSGAVPAAIQTIFNTLPPTDKLGAQITWASMTQVDRNHPLVSLLGAATGKTDDDIDEFFRQAVLL